MMRQDKYHVPMEDLSGFSLERSADLEEWEDAPFEELESILNQEPDEKARYFIEVVRGGSMCQLHGFFYRILPK